MAVPGEPCAGLAAGFGSLWVPLCGKTNSLARVDLSTNRVSSILPVGPALAEGGIAAGGDSLWMIIDSKGGLARINPLTGLVRQVIRLAPGSYNPLFKDGVVWATGHDAGIVTAAEASTGKIMAVVPVGAGPRFLTAGAGSIWVLLQGTGEVVRIDGRTLKVRSRTATGLIGRGRHKLWRAKDLAVVRRPAFDKDRCKKRRRRTPVGGTRRRFAGLGVRLDLAD